MYCMSVINGTDRFKLSILYFDEYGLRKVFYTESHYSVCVHAGARIKCACARVCVCVYSLL